jgi:predicted trehalose synthase
MHRDLKKVEGDSSKDFIELTDKLVKRELPDLNQELLTGIEKYPNPEEMLEIWSSLESQYFINLESKKQKVLNNYKTQITHGDFHIGQILKSETNYFVIDFDGSPVLNKELRNITSPIEDDLAHLLLSFTLAARVAERINQLNYGTLNDEVIKCQHLFLNNYLENSKMFHSYSANQDLIEYLRFRQYYFEIIYGLKFLPRWIYAPILSLKEELG